MIEYVFDTNIFINLQRRQPIDIYPSIWNKIDEMMRNGAVASCQEVLDEISVGGDELQEWAKERSEYFWPPDIEIQKAVREILTNHRGLVEGGKKKNSADPFIIALAKQNGCKVVTEESRSNNPNTPKIPDVCGKYNIECLDFVDFARENHFKI